MKQILILFAFMALLAFSSQYQLSYDENEATTYAYASSLAYCDIDKIKDFSCGDICDYLTEYKYLYSFKSDAGWQSITYVILYNEKTQSAIVSFSGTKNVAQLVDEILQSRSINYDLHEIGEAHVLKYFYNHYIEDLRSMFLVDLGEFISKSYLYPLKEVVFTGHSLGGAMTLHALLDAVYLNLIDPNQINVKVYTYGQPRVGDFAWSSTFKSKIHQIYRVVHYKDLVPHSPPCNPFQDTNSDACSKEGSSSHYYPYHIPTEFWYNWEFNSYQMCDSEEGEDSSCSDQHHIFNIDDHHYYFGVYVGECQLQPQADLEVENSKVEEKLLTK